MINPIETVYKGYRFRSRLEARWAVFLDSLNFTFVYEPDGYDLDGTWYLPDFWVPEWKAFLEIKPQAPTQEQMEKCQNLSNLTGHKTLLIAGQPWINEYTVFLFEPPPLAQPEDVDECDDGFFPATDDDDDFPGFTWVPLEFAQDRKDERMIYLCWGGDWYAENGWHEALPLYIPPDPHPRRGDRNVLTREWAGNITRALQAARQERFSR